MNPGLFSGLALVAGIFLASAITYGYGAGDGDLFWQRQLGEAVLHRHVLPAMLGDATFSAPQARWIPHEWIFATLWAAANRAGQDLGFRIGIAGIALLTLGVEAARPVRAGTRARAIMLVVVALAVIPSYGLRAQVLGWPLLALLMLALESGPRRAWFAVPIAVVWFNLHASALVVPVIVVTYGVGQALESRRIATLASPLALGLCCVAASAFTPFGISMLSFIIAWSANPATGLIYEWLPAAPDKIVIIAGVLVIAALLVAGECRGARLAWPQRLLALGLFAAAMLHIRNIGLFCIVTGPWAAASLSALLPRNVAAKEYRWRTDGALAAVALCAAVVLVFVRARAPHSGPSAAPAVALLVRFHEPLRVACEDFSWCSRFAADREIRVFLDGRTDAYPDAVFADYRRMLAGDALPVFARWRVDAAIVHVKGPLAKTLRGAGWIRLRNGEPQVYLRPGRAVAAD